MKKYLVLFFLLASLTSFGQFSNYTNINGRYKWIAGKFDSTFTLPAGTTPSLRTGGGTGPGAVFYRTSDSSLYVYTGTQWLKQADTSRFVPYVGARTNVLLGQYGLKAEYVEFDTTTRAVAARTFSWNNDEGTLNFGMTNGGTVNQRLGLEQFARVKNVDNSTILKGEVVYIYGASGDRAAVKKANNKADSTSSKTLGVAVEDISVNDVGFVGTFGVVSNLNLSAFTAGDIVYLDSISGQLTKTKPVAPYHMVFIGVVERANAGNGLLFINPQNGYELDELHNVKITSPANNSVLAYNSTTGLWGDTTLNGIGGVTGSGTTNYVAKFTGTNAVGNSQIFDNGTNVGIGTTSISSGYRLEVAGSTIIGRSNETAILQIRPNNGYGGWIQITEDVQGDRWTFGVANNSGTLRFGTGSVASNTARVEFFSNGNVGIGVSGTDGGQKLQVNGTGRVTTGSVSNGFTVGNSTGVNHLNYNGSTGNTDFYTFSSQNFLTSTGGDTRINGSQLFFYNSSKVYTYQQPLELRKQWPAIGGNIGFIFDNDTQGTPPAGSAYKVNQFKFSTSEVAFITGEGSFSGSGFGTFGTLTADSSAILQANSTSKGFLPPRMTGAQAEAIATPAEGLMIYANNGNGTTITSKGWWGYDGTTWVKLN